MYELASRLVEVVENFGSDVNPQERGLWATIFDYRVPLPIETWFEFPSVL